MPEQSQQQNRSKLSTSTEPIVCHVRTITNICKQMWRVCKETTYKMNNYPSASIQQSWDDRLHL